MKKEKADQDLHVDQAKKNTKKYLIQKLMTQKNSMFRLEVEDFKI